MPKPQMEELDDTECRRLLVERHLGRLAIPDFGGPVSFPINTVAAIATTLDVSRTWIYRHLDRAGG